MGNHPSNDNNIFQPKYRPVISDDEEDSSYSEDDLQGPSSLEEPQQKTDTATASSFQPSKPSKPSGSSKPSASSKPPPASSSKKRATAKKKDTSDVPTTPTTTPTRKRGGPRKPSASRSYEGAGVDPAIERELLLRIQNAGGIDHPDLDLGSILSSNKELFGEVKSPERVALISRVSYLRRLKREQKKHDGTKVYCDLLEHQGVRKGGGNIIQPPSTVIAFDPAPPIFSPLSTASTVQR